MGAQKTVTVNFNWLSILTVLFIGLKLTNYIDWSWFWVLAPTWGPFALIGGIAGLALLAGFVSAMLK